MEKKNEIYLRALEPDDYRQTIGWRNDAGLWNMLGGMRRFVAAAYEKNWMEEAACGSGDADVRLAICLAQTGQMIGIVSATAINRVNGSCVSHLMIGDPASRGRGYGSEALRQMARYMIDEQRIHRFEAKVLADNVASIRALEKVGYRREGLLRESVFKEGRFQDQVVMALLAPELR